MNFVAPHKIDPTHLSEWVEGSGVSESITKLNLRSISQLKEIAELLNWSAYQGSGGWYVNSVDSQTGQLRRYGQFKPDTLIQFPNAKKPCKYISFPKGDGIEVILLLPDLDTWETISLRYSVPILPEDIDESRLDLGFWKWVVDNPQLPLAVTEGAKKAGCLLSHGYIPVCLTGVWNGKQKKKLKAIPTLAPFLVQGRPIHLVFDSDIVVKRSVQEALKVAGYLAVKAGCIVGVATWEYTESTKGVDDFIVNQGLEAFEEIMDNLIPFKQWLKTIESEWKNEGGLVRLSTDKLIEYVRSTYRDRLKLNVLQQRVELDSAEMLLEMAYLHLAEHDGIDTTKNKAADVFDKIARENEYSPVITYLDTVAKEIAPIDLDNLSVRYFGTSNPLYDIFLKKTLIAAVARAYQPGCKHDTTLVLQGEQGVGKSSFFNVLGGEWFDDSMGDGRSKDDLIILHKSWIQEWGEIERVFGKRQAGEIKAFLTRKKDLFRPPYGRTAINFPRRGIVVGSINDAQFLVDPTGNRRYWVVPIEEDKIDLARLKQERDSIWSAAVAAYRKDEPWWLSSEEEKLSTENNKIFEIIDEWTSAIANYLEPRQQVSITELLQQVFNYELGQIQRRDQMRVASVLTTLEWKKAGQKHHQGKRQVVWILKTPRKLPIVEEVLRPQNQLQQQISIPSIPSIPNLEETSVKKTLLEEKNDNQLESVGKGIEQERKRTAHAEETSAIREANVFNVPTSLRDGESLQALPMPKALSASSSLRRSKKQLIKQTTKEVRRIGWGKKQAIATVKQRYGVRDRASLSIEQLTDFRDYLIGLAVNQTQDNQLTISVGDRVLIDDCPGHWAWASPFTVEAINGECAKLEMVSELIEINRLSLFLNNS